jgi:hypothetical protein
MTVRRWQLAGALLGLTLAFTACSSTPANDLEAGDCIEDEGALNDAVSGEDVNTIDCGESHQFQIIGKFDVDDQDDYPGESDLQDEGREECTGEIFQDFVGIEYNESSIYADNPLYPSEDSWDNGDRTIICVAYEPGDDGELSEVDESFEDAER